MEEKMGDFISNNELETKEIAKDLASTLSVGDIVILSRRIRCW